MHLCGNDLTLPALRRDELLRWQDIELSGQGWRNKGAMIPDPSGTRADGGMTSRASMRRRGASPT